MHPFDLYALAGALASGALAVLHGVVWRAHGERWSLTFSAAFLCMALLYGFDVHTRPSGDTPHPLAGVAGTSVVVLMTLGMIDYVGLRAPLARRARQVCVGAAVLMFALLAMGLITRLLGFAVLSLYLVAQAVMAWQAMRREPGRGHGLVVLALGTYPAVIVAALLDAYPVPMLRYAAVVPAAMLGMTVLTTGLLRARQQAREELQARQAAEEALRRANEDLEHRVLQRTAELREMVAALESFNRSISHDLRGPLGGIAGVSRLASEALDEGDPTTARRLLLTITRQAETSVELVASLLALARVNDSDLSPQPVALAPLVDDTLAQLRLADPEPLRVHVGPLPTVTADPGLLRQVFVNLIGNAVKFSRRAEAPSVEVGAYPENGGHTVFVRDNGVGFDRAAAGRLFEPFQRLHPSAFAGHGVGLSIVKRIVERHGGRVWAQGEPGRGATFYVWLGERGAAS